MFPRGPEPTDRKWRWERWSPWRRDIQWTAAHGNVLESPKGQRWGHTAVCRPLSCTQSPPARPTLGPTHISAPSGGECRHFQPRPESRRPTLPSAWTAQPCPRAGDVRRLPRIGGLQGPKGGIWSVRAAARTEGAPGCLLPPQEGFNFEMMPLLSLSSLKEMNWRKFASLQTESSWALMPGKVRARCPGKALPPPPSYPPPAVSTEGHLQRWGVARQ